MSASTALAVPTLSQVRAWDASALRVAGREWKEIAAHWDRSFEALHRQNLSPGGTVWEGRAAEAAQERSAADLVRVRGLAHALDDAAEVARRGADSLTHAKEHAFDAVDEAEQVGFTVADDWSVTPPSSDPVDFAQAEQHAGTIAHRLNQLVAHDRETADRIGAATAPLHGVTFPEHTVAGGASADRNEPTVKFAGRGTKPPKAPPRDPEAESEDDRNPASAPAPWPFGEDTIPETPPSGAPGGDDEPPWPLGNGLPYTGEKIGLPDGEFIPWGQEQSASLRDVVNALGTGATAEHQAIDRYLTSVGVSRHSLSSLSPETAAWLGSVAKHAGWVGNTINAGSAAYDLSEGAPLGETLGRAVGSFVGGTGGGWAAFALAGTLVAPEAVIPAAILFSVLGDKYIGSAGSWLGHLIDG